MTFARARGHWNVLTLAGGLVLVLLVGYALLHRSHGVATSTISPAAIAQQVGAVYGDSNPRIDTVHSDQTDNLPHQKMYLIMVRGTFHKGTITAQELDFSTTADGRDTWAIRGLTSTGTVAWLDNTLP